MLCYREALVILLEAADRRGLLSAETVPLAEIRGRVAAARLSAADDLPPFDNSSMDGYAVVSAATAGASPAAPVILAVAGSVAAGDPPPEPERAGGAYEIMTGAPVPTGCDAVVKIEQVRVLDGGRRVALAAPAGPGDFIRSAGQDFSAGEPAVEPGTILDARHVLALAALGVERVPVRRRPRVAVISTGRELVEPGRRPGPGQIRNSTAAYLAAVLPALGAETRFYGTVPDDPADFARRVRRALADSPDVLVTTGAISMGRHDFVTASIKELGAQILYHKVAIRPGKPGLVARFEGGPLVFGLPGNPVSTVVGVRFFLLPYIRRLLGMAEERPVRMRLESDAAKPEGLRCFYKAVASSSPDGATVRVLPGQASFQVRPLLESNAWAVMPEEGDRVPAGAEVEVFPILPGPCDLLPAEAAVLRLRRTGGGC